MNNKITDKFKVLDPKKRNAAVVVLTAVILVFVIAQFMAPQRSVAAYCKVFKDEKARLATFPGSTYPSGVFNEALSDAGEFSTSFGRLEKVAPNEIRPDVATLKLIYQKMHDDPAQAIGASLSAASAETSVKKWTNTKCVSEH